MKSSAIVDAVAYSDPFREHVQGQLKARFRLTSEGAPIFDLHDDDPRLRVYSMDIFLATPQAQQIKRVVYFMDDESYIDPKGFSSDSDNEFREEISSYGDVEIEVTVEMVQGNRYVQRAWLSQMLRNGHARDMTPAIREAIQRIKVF